MGWAVLCCGAPGLHCHCCWWPSSQLSHFDVKRDRTKHSHLQPCFYYIKGVQQQDCRGASYTTSNQVLPTLPLLWARCLLLGLL